MKIPLQARTQIIQLTMKELNDAADLVEEREAEEEEELKEKLTEKKKEQVRKKKYETRLLIGFHERYKDPMIICAFILAMFTFLSKLAGMIDKTGEVIAKLLMIR